MLSSNLRLHRINNSSDNFVHQKRPLSFGIRKYCVQYYTEGGVSPIGMEMISEPVDGAEDALTNLGWKWSSPDVSDFQLEAHLNKGELDFFSVL